MSSRVRELARIAYLWLHYHIPPVLRFRDLLHDWDRFCEADPAMREELQRLQQHPSDARTILILVMDPYWQMSR
ncbi:hypothetical protein HZA87_02300, partial [Candidatus Uhrbacteria bacterium]|nr:hypothetical protein [Candidatus Uhrbacteria bacterium]